MEPELPLLVNNGVASVAATRIAHNAVGILGKEVNHLALTLIAPLAADYRIGRHDFPYCIWLRPKGVYQKA